MRTRVVLIPALIVSLAACDKKSTPAAPGQPASVEKKAATAPGRRAAGARIDCNKLVPQELRAKYFGGAAMKQEPMCPGCPEHCKFATEKVPSPTVLADCRGGNSPGWLEQVSAMWEKAGYKKAPGVGRAAYTTGGMQFLFVPKTHNCYVTITWFGGGDQLAALARDIETNLTPAALGK